jgi:hypothetical protein
LCYFPCVIFIDLHQKEKRKKKKKWGSPGFRKTTLLMALSTHMHRSFWRKAGFASVFQARDAHCYPLRAHCEGPIERMWQGRSSRSASQVCSAWNTFFRSGFLQEKKKTPESAIMGTYSWSSTPCMRIVTVVMPPHDFLGAHTLGLHCAGLRALERASHHRQPILRMVDTCTCALAPMVRIGFPYHD